MYLPSCCTQFFSSCTRLSALSLNAWPDAALLDEHGSQRTIGLGQQGHRLVEPVGMVLEVGSVGVISRLLGLLGWPCASGLLGFGRRSARRCRQEAGLVGPRWADADVTLLLLQGPLGLRQETFEGSRILELVTDGGYVLQEFSDMRREQRVQLVSPRSRPGFWSLIAWASVSAQFLGSPLVLRKSCEPGLLERSDPRRSGRPEAARKSRCRMVSSRSSLAKPKSGSHAQCGSIQVDSTG